MKLERGINLGGFLSQCVHTKEHYDTFIIEKDIKDIAKLGFDHVRIPVDYVVLETEAGERIEEGYERIDTVLDWCKKAGLNVILDLHRAYGYDFNDAGTEANNLFSSEPLKLRFLKLWEQITERFAVRDNVAFELLNEVVEKENAESWNELIDRAVAIIRSVSATAPIIYGGIQWNSVKTLKLLNKPHDENIIFTFHFYEPLIFTHQKAHWVAAMDPNETINYPAPMEYYCKTSEKLGYQGEVVRGALSKTMGPEFITEMVKEAIDAAAKYNVKLYCGEFGVIDQAPVEDTLRWYTDVDTVFRKFNIGCAAWSYKKMDFGITDEHYAPIKDRLLKIWI